MVAVAATVTARVSERGGGDVGEGRLGAMRSWEEESVIH